MVVGIAYALKLNLFPSLQALFHQDLGSEGEGTLCQFDEGFLVRTDARPKSSEGISRADHDGEANLMCSFQGIVHVLNGVAHGNLQIHLGQLLDEEVAVFCIHDSFHAGAQHLHVIFLKDALLIELRAAVQRRLAAEGQQDAVRTLLLDDFGYKMWGDRLEVHGIGNAFRCLYRCNVGVDEYTLNTFLA